MPDIRALIVDDSSVMRKSSNALFAKPESTSRKCSRRVTAPRLLPY